MHVETPAIAACPSEAYSTKSSRYFAGARIDFLTRLPEDGSAQILEIGCGTGATGALALNHKRCGRYVGVELVPRAADVARDVLSEVHVGNVESMELPWQPCTFDAVILSEVLEHLIAPWDTLKRLAPLVRPGGIVLASSPNVSQWRVIRELIKGRFELADQGVYDRTHMRWFTPDTFSRMFSDAGFRVDWVGPVTPFSTRTELVSRMTGGRFDHLFMTQISLEGRRV